MGTYKKKLTLFKKPGEGRSCTSSKRYALVHDLRTTRWRLHAFIGAFRNIEEHVVAGYFELPEIESKIETLN